VAAYHVKVRFRRLAIGVDTAKEFGWLELWLTPQGKAEGTVDVRTEHAIERSVIVLLAGSQAERMALGRASVAPSRCRGKWPNAGPRSHAPDAEHPNGQITVCTSAATSRQNAGNWASSDAIIASEAAASMTATRFRHGRPNF
jgi:hypothetical protein